MRFSSIRPLSALAERARRVHASRPWVTVLAGVVVALLAVGLVMRLLVGSSEFTSDVTLTAQQRLALIAAVQPTMANQFAEDRARVGCAVYVMGARTDGKDQVVAYAQVLCNQCPRDNFSSEEAPVAVKLTGDQVVWFSKATVRGIETNIPAIHRDFPNSLWTAAASEYIPHENQASDLAFKRGGC